MPKIKYKCGLCGEIFYDWKSVTRKYCSIKCQKKEVKKAKGILTQCVWCGKKIKKYYFPGLVNNTKKERKYCSVKCRSRACVKKSREARAARRKLIPRKCVTCGKLFLPGKYNPHAKYCSGKCRKMVDKQSKHESYLRHYIKKPIQSKECVVCGKSFNTIYFSKKTCSIHCSIKNKKEYMKILNRKRNKDIEQKKCIVCGKDITYPIRGRSAKYCGKYCFTKNLSIKNNNKYKCNTLYRLKSREGATLSNVIGTKKTTKEIKKIIALQHLGGLAIRKKLSKEELENRLEFIRVGNTHEAYA